MLWMTVTLKTIDGVPIGQTTPAAGAFTTLKVSTDPVDEHGVGDRGFYDGRYMPKDLDAATITDPAINAAVTTDIIDAYGGVVITLTGAGNAQTLQNPTDTGVIKRFIVVADDSNGANTIVVNGITMSAGEAQWFIWDGSAWLAITAVDAADIAFTPSGSIVATEVQAAIEEVDSEKIPLTQKGAASGVASLNATPRVVEPPKKHAAQHVTGGDDIVANAISEGNAGLMSGADKKKLDDVETAADVTDKGNVGSSIHGADAKTTPVNADTVGLIDSAASNVLKKLSWANIKATLKSYFDVFYAAVDELIQATSDTLTVAEVRGTLISNYGQGAVDNLQALPAAAKGMNFVVVCGTAQGAHYLRIQADTDDKIYLDGVAGSDNGYVGIAAPVVGAMIVFFAFQTGVGTYDWIATTIAETWVAG